MFDYSFYEKALKAWLISLGQLVFTLLIAFLLGFILGAWIF